MYSTVQVSINFLTFCTNSTPSAKVAAVRYRSLCSTVPEPIWSCVKSKLNAKNTVQMSEYCYPRKINALEVGINYRK